MIRRVWSRIRGLKPDGSDILLWLGVLVVCCGVYLIYEPAGLILFGGWLVLLAVVRAKG